MRNVNRLIRSAAAVMVIAGAVGLTQPVLGDPVPILDQIGPSSATTTGPYWDSQFFEPAYAGYNQAAVDDFRAPAGLLNLSEIQAAVIGYQGFVSYAGVTEWSVEIYSSEAAAAANLVGDVASENFTPAQVTVDTSFGPAAFDGALVTIPVSITLPSTGVYYVSVIATNPYATNGEVFIDSAAFGTTQTNAFLANPNGAYGYTDNTAPTNTDLAYEIYAATPVPEPSAYALAGLSIVALLTILHRRRRA